MSIINTGCNSWLLFLFRMSQLLGRSWSPTEEKSLAESSGNIRIWRHISILLKLIDWSVYFFHPSSTKNGPKIYISRTHLTKPARFIIVTSFDPLVWNEIVSKCCLWSRVETSWRGSELAWQRGQFAQCFTDTKQEYEFPGSHDGDVDVDNDDDDAGTDENIGCRRR